MTTRKKAKSGASWIVAQGLASDRTIIRCEHCGDTVTIQLPARIVTVTGVTDAMVDAHRWCPKPPDGVAA